MKTFCTSLLAVTAVCLLLPGQASAGLLINIAQSGSDVVINGSGTLTTTGLTLLGTSGIGGFLSPTSAVVRLGSPSTGTINTYQTAFSPGGRFGTGGGVAPTSGTGNIFGLILL